MKYALFILTNYALAASYSPGMDQFTLKYEVEIPAIKAKQTGRIWIPVAAEDLHQKVKVTSNEPSLKIQKTVDRDFKNQIQIIDFDSKDAGKKLVLTYDVERREKSEYANMESDLTLYKRAESLIPLDARFKRIATEVTGGKKTDLDKGRAIYDYVLKTMTYSKAGTGWGRGDAAYACDVKTGNCTDFHALFIAVARSAGIASRFAIGFTIPADKRDGKIDGYHCWAEFLADGKWVPVDISEADKNPKEKEYYFGHHPANRFEVSRGRDLRVVPAPRDGAINFLVHPQLEVDGKTQKYVGNYSFVRTPNQLE